MFRNDIVAKRIGRIGFGSVLILGAILMVFRARLPWPAPAAAIMVGSWLAAFAAAGVLSSRRYIGHYAPDAYAKAGLIVPSIGIMLMLPLLIHLPFALALGGSEAYDDWVSISIWISGLTTLVAATLAAVRAHSLVVEDQPIPVWVIYVACVVVSCVPFAVFVLPPIITAITGLPIALLLHYQARLVERERLQAGTAELPRAIAVTA